MTLATYADLTAAVADWLARADIAPRIPDFVTLAEARIAYGAAGPFPSEPVRLRAMETVADMTLDAPSVALPDGFLEAIRLTLETVPRVAVQRAAPDWLRAVPIGDGTTAGRPVLFAIEGGALVLAPAPDQTYPATLLYRRRFAPLAESGTNWLLANAPGVHLYATLLEAALYTGDEARAQTFYVAFKGAAEGVTAADASGRAVGPMLRMRASVGAV